MNTPTKRCKKCLRDLPLDQFYFRKDTQRYRDECKRCNLDKRGHKAHEKYPDGYKRCNQCQLVLPHSSFNLDKSTKDKRQFTCRECQRLLKKKWDATAGQTPDQKRKVSKRSREWNQKHPGIHRKRYAENPERINASLQRRRARKLGLPDTLTAEQWKTCLKHFDHRCAYCGNPPGLLPFTRICADHWIPLINPLCPGTVASNIVPACKSCNSKKRSGDPFAWLEYEFGKRVANRIAAKILEYFASLDYTGT